MRRTLIAFAGITLAIGIVACERSQMPTDPTIEPRFRSTSLVEFEAQFYDGSLTSVVCNQGVCDLEFAGSGVANIMGQVTFTNHVVEDFTSGPCNDAPAEIVITGATGSISLADVTGSVCPNPSGMPTMGFISAHWEVTGGTGEFEGIEGSGISRGPIGGNGPAVHLSGTVSY